MVEMGQVRRLLIGGVLMAAALLVTTAAEAGTAAPQRPHLMLPADTHDQAGATVVYVDSIHAAAPVRIAIPAGARHTGSYTARYDGTTCAVSTDTRRAHSTYTCATPLAGCQQAADGGACRRPYAASVTLRDHAGAVIEHRTIRIAVRPLQARMTATSHHRWLPVRYQFPAAVRAVATVTSADTGQIVFRTPLSTFDAGLRRFAVLFRWHGQATDGQLAQAGTYRLSVTLRSAEQTAVFSKTVHVKG
jgi:hypothetical protein